LIYDAGSTSTDGLIASQLAVDTLLNGISEKGSEQEAQTGRVSVSAYLGTDDQLPDPRMQATLGVANTPAYRGLAYIVFNDFELTDFGNSLMGAQFKVEVMQSATWTPACALTATMTFEQFTQVTYHTSTIRYSGERFYVTYMLYDDVYTNLAYIGRQTAVFTNPILEHDPLVALPPYNELISDGNSQCFALQSDEDIAFFTRGKAVNSLNGVVGIDASGNVILDTYLLDVSYLPYANYRFVVDRGDIYATYNGKLYHFSRTVHPEPAIITASSEDFDSGAFGASENYVFMVVNNGNTTTTTVKKVSRGTLTTVETITFSADSRWASIRVISDSLFYLRRGRLRWKMG
jgi:hypothetical protein